MDDNEVGDAEPLLGDRFLRLCHSAVEPPPVRRLNACEAVVVVQLERVGIAQGEPGGLLDSDSLAPPSAVDVVLERCVLGVGHRSRDLDPARLRNHVPNWERPRPRRLTRGTGSFYDDDHLVMFASGDMAAHSCARGRTPSCRYERTGRSISDCCDERFEVLGRLCP